MEAIRYAVENGKLTSAVLMATNRRGDYSVSECFGIKNAAGRPRTERSVCRMASCTKLLTAVAVMQGVERGLLDLDAPVRLLVPELGELRILTGYDEAGNAMFRESGVDITLTHLLTHSSGIGYPFVSPDLARWCADNGKAHPGDQPAPTLAENYLYPLLFEPGTGWSYGAGVDWAGRVLEVASGMSLDDWVQKHMAGPLGVNITFYLQRRDDMAAARAEVPVRQADGSFEWPDRNFWHEDPKECLGGKHAFCDPGDLFEILTSLLREDKRLLNKENRARLFAPALTAESREACREAGRKFAAAKPHGFLTESVQTDYALGGMVVMEDQKARDGTRPWRKAGSLSWSGATNHYWNVDPEARVCTLVSFNMDPWGDDACVDLGTGFEEEVYTTLAARSATS